MLFYLITFAMVIPSPVLMFISSEAWAVFVGLTGQRSWFLLALTLAAGQTVGFSLLYFFGGRILGRLPRLKARLDRFDQDSLARKSVVLLSFGSLIGLPPHNLMAIACPVVGVRYVPFVAITFTGRALRYCVLAGAPAFFADKVGTDWIPEWIRALV